MGGVGGSEGATTKSVCRKLSVALFAWLVVAATWGCGEMDILAIDRSKVNNAAGSSNVGPLDAGASDAQEVPDAPVPPSPNGIYLEAESGQLSGGFTVGSDPSASGGQFLAPPPGMSSTSQPGSARSLYEIVITTPGTYIIWGRIQSPDTQHNRFWVQVDGKSWYLWYITTGEIWYWNRIHNDTNYYEPLTFDLGAGQHTLLLANATDGVRLDRLYLTTGKDIPPGNDTPCRPPDSIQVDGGCVPSCGSLTGNSCGVPQCMGRMVLGPVYDCQVCCFRPLP
jgi:hypothetical protein